LFVFFEEVEKELEVEKEEEEKNVDQVAPLLSTLSLSLPVLSLPLSHRRGVPGEAQLDRAAAVVEDDDALGRCWGRDGMIAFVDHRKQKRQRRRRRKGKRKRKI
jgi:hypothetical protein